MIFSCVVPFKRRKKKIPDLSLPSCILESRGPMQNPRRTVPNETNFRQSPNLAVWSLERDNVARLFLTLIRMTKDEKCLAFFKGLLL
jgi:hypothetical protein